MFNRVAITGLGAITPAGNTVLENWQNIIAGNSGIDFIKKFDTENFPIKIAGEIDVDIKDYIEGKDVKHFDPFIQYALIATQEAVLDAGIQDFKEVGVIIGSGQGGISNIEKEHAKLINGKLRRVTPFFIPSSVIGMAAGVVSSKFGFRGPNYGVSSACATSAHAIMDACKMIAIGEVDTVVTGGAEATITPLSMAGFSRLNALNTETQNPAQSSRPFDLQRKGFVMGEGAGIVVLENMATAIKRGAHIYGEVVGFGATSDASHLTAPSPDGIGQSLAMQKALDMAQIESAQVGYINAHGTSTPLNDKIETMAIKQVFDRHANQVSISSTKSMTGHLLGAAGVVEFIYSIQAIKNSEIPPTINLKDPDPDCDLNYTANKSVSKQIEYALSNSFGFGGTNASLLVKKAA